MLEAGWEQWIEGVFWGAVKGVSRGQKGDLDPQGVGDNLGLQGTQHHPR